MRCSLDCGGLKSELGYVEGMAALEPFVHNLSTLLGSVHLPDPYYSTCLRDNCTD